jgi:hypothetical protein
LPGIINVTTEESYLKIPEGYLPGIVIGLFRKALSKPGAMDGNGNVLIGPIPAGIPVNLISNINVKAPLGDLLHAFKGLKKAVSLIKSQQLSGESARKAFMETAGPGLLAVSSCKDFVVNRGHYFGTGFSEDSIRGIKAPMSSEEKEALIEYLKHF